MCNKYIFPNIIFLPIYNNIRLQIIDSISIQYLHSKFSHNEQRKRNTMMRRKDKRY